MFSIIAIILSLNIMTINSAIVTNDFYCCITFNIIANTMILQNSSNESAYYMNVDDCINLKVQSNRNCSSFIGYEFKKNNLLEFRNQLNMMRYWECTTDGICSKSKPLNINKPESFSVYRIFYRNLDNIKYHIKIIDTIISFFKS